MGTEICNEIPADWNACKVDIPTSTTLAPKSLEVEADGAANLCLPIIESCVLKLELKLEEIFKARLKTHVL